MIDAKKVLWGRIIGTATGSVLAGPAGALVGNLAGGLLQTFLPGAAGVAAILGDIVGKVLEKWDQPEKRQLNHDLQTTFRDALVEAIYDIGGKLCYSNQWAANRNVPEQIDYPITALQRQDAALASQVCLLFQKMAEAVKEQQILPLEPPADQPLG